MDEWQLVTEAQAGSHEAFAQLVLRYDAFLRRLVAHYVGSDDLPDAAQEIWLMVYRKLWQLEEGDRLRPWLKRVVFYQCINFRKARLRHRRAEAHLNTEGWIRLTECVAADGYQMDELLERRETRRFVTRQLDELPADYGQILRLRYMQNKAYKEIASLAGLSESTVKWRLHEAKRLLKARLLTVVKEGREHR